jgi:hypothetical protein
MIGARAVAHVLSGHFAVAAPAAEPDAEIGVAFVRQCRTGGEVVQLAEMTLSQPTRDPGVLPRRILLCRAMMQARSGR